MNRFYRHIWSKALGRVIVVPECARGGGGKKGGRRRHVAKRLCANALLTGALILAADAGFAVEITTDTTLTSTNYSPELHIGGSGVNATATVQAGDDAASPNVYIGSQPGDIGTLIVIGSGTTFTTGGHMRPGLYGNGTLQVLDGAVVSNNDGYVGFYSNSVGTVSVDGAGSHWDSAGGVDIGLTGAGTVLVRNGGQVSADVLIDIAQNAGSTGSLAIGAASGDAAAAAGTIATPLMNFGAGTGQIVFNHTDPAYEFAPVLTGAGTVRVEAGHTSLTGDNTYSGNTLLSGGTLTLGHSNALGTSTLTTTGSVVDYANGVNIGNAVIIDSNTTQFQVLTGSATHSGVISEQNGSRPLEKIGAGELVLTNDNLWTGLTTVREGTLTFDGGSVDLSDDLVVGGTNGLTGNLRIEDGGSLEAVTAYLGNVAGSTGQVTVTGTGSTLLTSDIQYIGRLGDGTLTISDGGVVTNTNTGTSAEVGLGYDGNWNNEYNTAGTIIVTDSGSRWDNAGAIYIGARDTGNLTISNGGVVTSALGSLGGNDTNAIGTAIVSGSGSQWNASAIDVGNGDVGILTIANDGVVNVNFGNGTVRLGVLGTGNGTLNIGSVSGDAAAAAGTLNAAAVSFGSGAGRIVFNHNESAYNFASNISGGGSLLVEDGVTALTGTNTYSGGTMIAGGTLVGTATSLQGNITNNSALVFDQSVDGIYAGILSGAGTLTKQGTGNVTFSGTSAGFTGDTTVSGGTLTVTGTLGDDSGGANGSSLTVQNGGTLNIGTSRNVNAASITNQAGGIINLGLEATLRGTGNTLNNSGVINVDNMGLVTDAGAINNLAGGVINFAGEGQLESDTDNSGGEAVINDGMINLNGDNSQTVLVGNDDLVNQGSGIINVNDGLLRVNGLLTNSSPGAAVGGAGGVDIGADGELNLTTDGLRNNAGGEVTNAGRIRGDIENNAGATLISTGEITGGRSLENRGTVGAEGTINQDVFNRDTGVFNVSGALAAFHGFNVQDAAVLNVTGGNLTINDTFANTSTAANGVTIAVGRTLSADTVENGDTNINAVLLNNGTLTATNPIVNAGTIQNNGTVNGGLLNFRSLTNAGVLNGGLTNNDGTVTNSGTVNGSIAVNGGTFITHAAGQTANIANDGALVFDQAVDGVYAGVISGNGTLAKQGAGALTLDDDSSAFAGTTTVSDGLLVINGALGGTLNMDGGTLGGSGSLGDVTLESGATLAPGNSIGALSVAGDFAFGAGSIYEVEVNDGGNTPGVNNDFIDIAGALTIDSGAVVEVVPENGTDDGASYAPSTTYTILTADGGISGVFGGVTAGFAFLTPELSYDTTSVFLTLTQMAAFEDVASTPNQQGVAAATEALGAGNLLYDEIIVMSQEDAQAAFDALSGEAHASSTGVFSGSAGIVRRTIFSRLFSRFGAPRGFAAAQRYVPAAGDETPHGYTLWGELVRGWGETDGSASVAGIERHSTGFLGGVDREIGEASRIGFALGYSRSDFDVSGRSSSGESDNVHLAGYAGTELGSVDLKAVLGYSYQMAESRRRVVVGSVVNDLSADYGAHTFQASGEASLDLEAGSVTLTPFAGLAVVHVETEAFTETGGPSALSISSSGNTTGTSELGLRAAREAGSLTLFGSASWRHVFGDVEPLSRAAFASSPATTFSVRGTPLSEDVASLGGGVELLIAEETTLELSYRGEFASDSRDHGLKAKVSIRF